MADQTITTRFKTEGAGRVAKDTEAVGRAQTRLGQASASAGRSFSAQANGLGGLVGVYAAAAANVFAITAAFDALGRAAQAEQIVRGTKLLALEIGQSGASILDSVQKITQSQLTLAESSQNINIALSAGFNSDQIEQLSEVSLKASRALGRNLTDAFQRVVRGASKLEPELLDELGIFTRIDPAVEAYASKLNIAASSLTNYEKRQAFVNAVIEEGQKKFSAIDTTIGSSQKTFEQLRVSLVELATEFGILVANGLAPVAEFFKNNIGNALLLFGGILGLVFGRAISAVGGFAAQSIQRLSAFTEVLANSAAKMGSFSKAADALEGSVGRAKGGVGAKIFQTRIAGQGEGEAAALRDTLNFQEKGQLRTAAALNRANKLYRAQLTLLDSNSDRYKILNALIKENEAALKGAGFRAQAFIAISNALGVSVKGLSTAFSILGGIVGGLFTGIAVAQLIGSFFDVDVLKEIRDFFRDTSKAAEDLRVGVLGAVDAASGGNLVQQLKNVGATKEDIENLTDTLNDLNKETTDAANTSGIFSRILLDSKQRGIVPLDTSIASLTESQRRLIVLQNDLARETAKGTDADRQRLLVLRNLIKAQQEFGGVQRLIGGISDNLALSATKVADILKDQQIVFGDRTFLNFAKNIEVADKSFGELNENQQKVITTFVLLENTLDKADKAFQRGSASSETLSKQLGGARKALQDFIEANTVEDDEGLLQFLGDPATLKRQQEQIENISKQVRSLKALETQGKALTDIFGKYNKVLDDAIATGTVGFDGIAKSAEEVIANQANFLARQAGLSDLQQDQIKNEQVLAALGKEASERNSEEVKLIENRGKAIKAVFGLAVQLPQEIEKERLARERILETLKQQLTLQTAQNDLQILQNNANLEREQRNTQLQLAEKNLELSREQLNLDKAIFDQTLSQQRLIIDLQKQEFQAQKRIADLEDMRTDRADKRARFQRESAIAAQKSVIADFNAFPNLRSQDQTQAEQRKLIDLELQNQLAIIGAKERQAERERQRAVEEINQRESLIEKEINFTLTQLANLRQLAEKEEALLLAQEANALNRISSEQQNLKAQLDIVDQQNKIALLNIDAQEKKFQLDNEQFERQILALETQAAVVNKFVEALGSDNKFTQAIQAYLEEQNAPDLVSSIVQAGGPQQISTDFSAIRDLQDTIKQVQGNLIASRRQGADIQGSGQSALLREQIARQEQLAEVTRREFDLKRQIAEATSKSAIEDLNNKKTLLEVEKSNLLIELDLIKEAADAKKEGYAEERSLAKATAEERKRQLLRDKQTLGDLGNSVIGNINDGVGNAFQTAFDNLAQGNSITEGLGDVLRSTFENVRKTVLEETLIKPLQENIKSSLGGLFGFDEKGADNAKVIGGALLTTSADGTTPTEVVSDIKEQGVSAFESIIEKLGLFKDSALETFGSMGDKLGGVFSSVFNSIGEVGGSIFSSFGGGGGGGGLLSSLGGLFSGGKASGGIVHMAAGGMVRDRVPTMLEPGEFVMKRSSTSDIGVPALNAMNATGKAGGNVVVNIQNQGTPQDATASEPRFDGEKFVIDIVTRDLRNNGPIRKSLRGGA